jgi:hypothetical protein
MPRSLIVAMKLRLATLLLMLFPLAGTAQTLPSLVPPSKSATPLVDQLLAIDPAGAPLSATGASVLPIWSGSSGELLAVVALPRGWVGSPIDATPAYAGPSSWQLAGSVASAGGMMWQLGNGLHVDAMLGQYLPSISPSPSCLSNCETTSPWMRGSLAGSLGMGWTAADGGLDISYGLSWLQSQGSGLQLGNLTAGALPALVLPDAPLYALGDEAAIYARGRWRFEQGAALDVSASYGRGHLSSVAGIASPLASAIDLDQLSLSLGLDAGSLRGAVVGHVLSSDDPALAGKRWTTLDLGVSWRTPWSGELSVGAQNLWSAPLNSPRDTDNQARTPYIQYRQDL